MALPTGWDNILPGQMRKEAVLSYSNDYNNVISEFMKTSPNFTIIKVWKCIADCFVYYKVVAIILEQAGNSLLEMAENGGQKTTVWWWLKSSKMLIFL